MLGEHTAPRGQAQSLREEEDGQPPLSSCPSPSRVTTQGSEDWIPSCRSTRWAQQGPSP